MQMLNFYISHSSVRTSTANGLHLQAAHPAASVHATVVAAEVMSEADSDLASKLKSGGRGEGSPRSKYDGGSTVGLTMGGGDDDGKRSGGYGRAGSREGVGGMDGDNDEIASRTHRWRDAEGSASPLAAATPNPRVSGNGGVGDDDFQPSPQDDANGQLALHCGLSAHMLHLNVFIKTMRFLQDKG